MRRLAPFFFPRARGGFVALLASMLGACGAPTAVVESVTVALGEPVWIPVGASVAAADGSVSFRFNRVLGDSRCHAPLVCVWEGEVELEVVGGAPITVGWLQADTLRSVMGPRVAAYASLQRRVRLLEVAGGDPAAGAPQYRARFVIEGVGAPAALR